MFDMSKINLQVAAEVGADLHLMHPIDDELIYQDEEKKKPVKIKLLGHDSKAWRNKNREFSRKRTAAMQKRKGKGVDFTPSDEEASEMLAACTMSWENVLVDGEEIEFTKEVAYDLYMEQPWIREQADVFIGDRANFFTNA